LQCAPLIGVCVAALTLAQGVSAQPLPSGWQWQQDGAKPGARRFEATGLPAGEFAQVHESPWAALDGRSPQQWLADAAAADTAPNGVWASVAVATPQSTTLVTATRSFTTTQGRHGTAIYFAASPDARRVRLLRAVFSSPELGRGLSGAQARTLLADLMRGDRITAAGAAPATATAAAPDASAAAPARAAVRYVTASGTGLRAADVETVYHHWDQRYDAFQGLTLTEAAYLLLKDGTVHDGLDVPPDQFDVTASRRGEPQSWGRWRKRNGRFEFAWPFAPGQFDAARGNAIAAAAAGTTLEGVFEGSASYVLPGGGTTSWSTTRVRLAADGRFEFERSGGAAVSGGGGNASTMTVHDDDRVSSSTNSSVMAAGGSRKRADTGNRRGRYRIEGYAIDLRYDDGTVERRPFFIDEGGAGIWLLGTRLARAKPGRL